ncbi:LacI family DNA-binding transcriptional regulator [Hymenobacter sp. ASUV-10]|uniref:LacI family DNA-binding transcriptional regulator n=1 Tax=Hymenobacter aranciens TaxID=3063996 RepID=A0ABT9B4Z4_9BACT|nr:LacI family DNA-binding transcriptional regulator [Hymenobacter sp. ASUV-10]MDO7873319.1 LacI family DNA-binding transcriptional regulator [Hymenobacter sp. ASUV-10]
MASPKKTEPAAPAPTPTGSSVSMADLARELGVSMTTISRALSDHHSIGPAMKQKVLRLAKKYNYQPNRLASALRKGKSKLLGIVVPYIEGRFFPSVVHGIETAASKAGYNVIICQSNEDMAQERRNLESLLSAQVAGILVSLARTTNDFRHFDKLRNRGLPLVFFDRVVEGDAVNAVVLDDREGGYLSTRHLLQQGRRRIAHLAGPQHLNIYKNRRQGYFDALREAGLPADESLVVYNDMAQEQGAEALRQLLALPNPPDGLFAAGDYAALGALQEAQRQGLRVPEDLAITGFSNETFTLVARPTITTVDQRCEEMGQAAVRLLLEMIDNGGEGFSPRQVVLRPELVVRGSSTPGDEDDSHVAVRNPADKFVGSPVA